jgi:hypothetical protein
MRVGRLAFQKVVLAAEMALLVLGILLVTVNHEHIGTDAILERAKTLGEQGASATWQWIESTFEGSEAGDKSK